MDEHMPLKRMIKSTLNYTQLLDDTNQLDKQSDLPLEMFRHVF